MLSSAKTLMAEPAADDVLEARQAVKIDLKPIPRCEPTVILQSGADVKIERINWLWYQYLAAGKIHILAGAPGVGKTTCALRLAAIVSAGAKLPDGTQCEQRDVLIWSGEDTIEDTLAPRLVASGADMRRIRFVTASNDANGSREFDPARDITALEKAITEQGLSVGLLIVDPIVSATTGDSHKNAEVRRSLQPLADLAKHQSTAVLGITHFSKGTQGREPTERVTGSLAFGALARVVIVCAKLPDDSEIGTGCVFTIAKSNIGADTGGFRYHLDRVSVPGYLDIYASVAVFAEPLDGSAREILRHADTTTDEVESERQDLDSFLMSLLSDGPLSSKQVEADVRGAGYSLDKARRRAKKLGIESYKVDMKSGWFWRLPKIAESAEDRKDCNLSESQSSPSSAQSSDESSGFSGPEEAL